VRGLTSISLLVGGCCHEETKSVMFADGSWDMHPGAQPHRRLYPGARHDYKAEYTFGDTIPLFNGLAHGDIDVCKEVWVENQQQAYDEYIADASVIDLGVISWTTGRAGWCQPI
jgi:hypothetical protein